MNSIGKLFNAVGEKFGITAGQDTPSAKPTNVDDIRNWLAVTIAAKLKTDAARIDYDTSFSQMGLDSLAAIGISVQIEQWLNTEIEATILYQHPTISQLSNYLASKVAMPY